MDRSEAEALRTLSGHYIALAGAGGSGRSMRKAGQEFLAIGAACAASVTAACFAYLVVGWLGVGVLGVLIAFIAVRTELEQDGPVGSQQTAELFAASLRRHDQMHRAEKAARRAEAASIVRAGLVAKVIGGIMIVIGLGGFYFFQLPR
jgi:hypothetical protein